MDGVLVIDKPQGLTSHDVVAAARRVIGDRRIGHTGTLDPLATGVLPLAVGRAVRLVRFFVTSDKEYDATIRFGLTTDSYDITGAEITRSDAVPAADTVTRALGRLTGDYLQTPPAYSAKKVKGRRAYELARNEQAVALAAAPVRVERAELLELTGVRARVAIACSAGFYVRSFAHALGDLVGTGACLEALRRTRTGEFGLDAAVRMDELHDRTRVEHRLIHMDALMTRFPAVRVTGAGRDRVAHGREIEPREYEPAVAGPAAVTTPTHVPAPAGWVRILDERGALIGLATAGGRPGSLHPAVVLI